MSEHSPGISATNIELAIEANNLACYGCSLAGKISSRLPISSWEKGTMVPRAPGSSDISSGY